MAIELFFSSASVPVKTVGALMLIFLLKPPLLQYEL